MKKSELRGLIQEEICKVLGEDQGSVNKILDKISAQGIKSLSDAQKEYLKGDPLKKPSFDSGPELRDFIEKHSKDVAKALNTSGIQDIDFDGEKDVAAINSEDEDNWFAFRDPEDVDSEFYGAEGDDPRPIEVAGRKLLYITGTI